ncbi:hypothetical protein K437DRAFT_68840 [Tilletiaria anomala UBC 951]|uniref:Uncharacterized protein n=1 Tax=Tilletiaria anomala (strain ATCC 24038 / CBS 436.72 / UBC 951) TaxID=1037660 RepID=A0A066WRT3_TILAU|nr:uncharacterized protein K437DRAFT_68840 [Tilletiaria anomala UBC 951]KDN53345.1 hypothetical protein K437DRAFT_68840 [Tilletiaria anomala UBC 951]
MISTCVHSPTSHFHVIARSLDRCRFRTWQLLGHPLHQLSQGSLIQTVAERLHRLAYIVHTHTDNLQFQSHRDYSCSCAVSGRAVPLLMSIAGIFIVYTLAMLFPRCGR